MKKIINSLILLIIVLTTYSCGGFKKIDQRERPTSPEERRREAVNTGKGTGINDLFKKRGSGGIFEFSSSNPMWRASLETLDFLPLTTVDYSGGVIITDWYSDSNSAKESIKISLRFLANEIRSESLKVIVHQKTCSSNLDCRVILLNNTKIKEELHTTILKKAALLEKESKEKKKK